VLDEQPVRAHDVAYVAEVAHRLAIPDRIAGAASCSATTMRRARAGTTKRSD